MLIDVIIQIYSFHSWTNDLSNGHFGDLLVNIDANTCGPDVYFSVDYIDEPYEMNTVVSKMLKMRWRWKWLGWILLKLLTLIKNWWIHRGIMQWM